MLADLCKGSMAALNFSSDLLEPGELLAIGDGVLNDLGMAEDYDAGPNRAIAEYLDTHLGVYEVAADLCDMFGRNAKYNPNGYLRRTTAG